MRMMRMLPSKSGTSLSCWFVSPQRNCVKLPNLLLENASEEKQEIVAEQKFKLDSFTLRSDIKNPEQNFPFGQPEL